MEQTGKPQSIDGDGYTRFFFGAVANEMSSAGATKYFAVLYLFAQSTGCWFVPLF
jgi:hypothetical protein